MKMVTITEERYNFHIAEIERLRQRDGFINNLDKQIIEKDKEIDKLLDALWDIHSMCNNWPLVSAYRIKQHIRLTLGGM